MSSLRNAVARRPHKERSQPSSRSKWGLLEKHKDYSLRAKDYNAKKQKLSILSQKSRERHPDEFNFGMLSAESSAQGKHGRGDQQKNRLSHDAVKLLKTQDAGYLRTAAGRNRREIEKLEEQVNMGQVMETTSGVAATNGLRKKVLFEEYDDTRRSEPAIKRRKVSHEAPDDLNERVVNGVLEERTAELETESLEHNEAVEQKPQIRSKKSKQKEQDALTRLKAERKKRKRLQEMRAAKLDLLRKRQKEITAVADQLELQRAKMARAIGGTNKDGVKFKIRERKK